MATADWGLPVFRPAWTSSKNVCPRSPPHPRRYSGNGSRKTARARRPGSRRSPSSGFAARPGRSEAAELPPPSLPKPAQIHSSFSPPSGHQRRCSSQRAKVPPGPGKEPGLPTAAGGGALWSGGSACHWRAVRTAITPTNSHRLRSAGVALGHTAATCRIPALKSEPHGCPTGPETTYQAAVCPQPHRSRREAGAHNDDLHAATCAGRPVVTRSESAPRSREGQRFVSCSVIGVRPDGCASRRYGAAQVDRRSRP